ncbi:LysR family transcriptional regulator [Bacillus smithii]|uniref:LysR family transcriptional regulator n=1 Tax=Bacillus smithii TaxID=1479 RepID=UPI0022E18C75|nr:LysR family transcriptional regulator [Bacillus smithii]MED1488477.1 LysR family transcriptional regulator [Bacillus smithii]
MELRQIKYFIEVAKQEHVTEAANQLHVAQSAVSRQIARLEDELGVVLFARDGRNVKLTHIGKIFLEHIENAMEEIDKSVKAVKDYLNPKQGMIRIGFPNSLAAKTLPRVISAFRKQYPEIGFKFWQGSNKELRGLVENGEIDLAFVSPVPTDSKINTHIFFSERMRALLPFHHPLAQKKEIRLYELRKEPFVLFQTGYDMRKMVMDACRLVGFEPDVAFESEDIYTIKGLVEAGLGISLLPESTLDEQSSPETVSITVSDPIITRTVGVIYPKSRDLPPTEKLFFDFLKQYYERLNQFSF